ncbi:hypothetical protein LWI29_027760 [Acer saccharum]|uniref:Uncharacterized protein n=1 Tax=Acer saccharum TaxID=4024 RepID=A0AA39VRM9_ACESA|nr:hypothetical protein LWI29_027760 [Acer saccharum]
MESWFFNENSGSLVYISCEEYAMFLGFMEDMFAKWLKLVRGFHVFGVFLDVSVFAQKEKNLGFCRCFSLLLQKSLILDKRQRFVFSRS